MLEKFILDIKFLYQSILKGEKPSLVEFKNKWEIKRSIGETYQKLTKREDKKEKGSFYTPYEVVDYMVTELVKNIDLEANPNIKILDPSCGGGYFLISLVDHLSKQMTQMGRIRDSSPNNKQLQMRDSSLINKVCELMGTSHDEDLDSNLDRIYKHILENNLYGFDIDENAVMVSIIELYEKTGHAAKNILVRDFLLEDENQYDFIIGNPPYMGHKVLKREYRELLKDKYSEVFKDKGDLAYCFIKKSIDSLRTGGRMNFFTSRYLLEALNGADTRKYILEKGRIISLIDFYGIRVVKGAGVDTIIIDFIKENIDNCIDFYRFKETAKGIGKRVFEDIGKIRAKQRAIQQGRFMQKDKTLKYAQAGSRGQLSYLNIIDEADRLEKRQDENPSHSNLRDLAMETDFVKNIRIQKSQLNESGWIFLTKLEKRIIDKLEGVMLSDICNSNQGIITGCDDAFVISKDEAIEFGVEKELLKPWIKGKSVNRFKVDNGNELLIYSDLIENELLYPGAIRYISRQKGRLKNRRECLKGIRRWFGLQWGRNAEIFEETKIIFPYKSSSNRFAINKGSFFSADVYSLQLKNGCQEKYSYEFLVGVLNSRIYEFYIKTMAKKLGEDLYEYYPNKIMNIRMPGFIKEIEDEVKRGDFDIRDRIDRALMKHFMINDEEYEVIKGWCK